MARASSAPRVNDPQTYAIIGAAREVHGELGPGFLEAVYQEALCLELSRRDIPYKQQLPLPIFYKGDRLHCGYRADLLCYGQVIVELKASHQLRGIEVAQVLNYLKATGFQRALLLNFGTPTLEVHRYLA